MVGAEGSNLALSSFPHIWLNPTSVLPICADAFFHLPNSTSHRAVQHSTAEAFERWSGLWPSGSTDDSCAYFTTSPIFAWILFIGHLSSQIIVSWHSLESKRGRKTINYFWLTSSIRVCVCRGMGCCAFFFNRASGLNWVNWHLAIRSDSPALCGSVYGSKISSVRLSAWAVVLLEVLTPLLAGISARGVNGNTKKSIVRCRVGREEKKFCSKQLKLAQTEIFGDLTSQQQQWDRGGSSHCTDGPGFTLSFQNHRCPHSVVAFCFSLWTCPVDAIFNCLWVSFIRGWHYLGFVPHFDLRFATDLLVLCVWGTASFSGDTEPIGAMGSHPCCQWWDWGTERAVHSAVSLDRGGLATLTRRSTIVENGLRELWRESRLFFFLSDSPYLPWARLINTCEAFARKVPRSSL